MPPACKVNCQTFHWGVWLWLHKASYGLC